jgi:hypothetical protein
MPYSTTGRQRVLLLLPPWSGAASPPWYCTCSTPLPWLEGPAQMPAVHAMLDALHGVPRSNHTGLVNLHNRKPIRWKNSPGIAERRGGTQSMSAPIFVVKLSRVVHNVAAYFPLTGYLVSLQNSSNISSFGPVA